MVLDRNEKQRGFPSLSGMETQYNQVRVVFEPNFEKRLVGLATIVPYGSSQPPASNVENSGDLTAS